MTLGNNHFKEPRETDSDINEFRSVLMNVTQPPPYLKVMINRPMTTQIMRSKNLRWLISPYELTVMPNAIFKAKISEYSQLFS